MRERAELLAKLIKEAAFDEAIALIHDDLRKKPGDMALNERLRRLLCAVPGQEAAMIEHTTR